MREAIGLNGFWSGLKNMFNSGLNALKSGGGIMGAIIAMAFQAFEDGNWKSTLPLHIVKRLEAWAANIIDPLTGMFLSSIKDLAAPQLLQSTWISHYNRHFKELSTLRSFYEFLATKSKIPDDILFNTERKDALTAALEVLIQTHQEATKGMGTNYTLANQSFLASATTEIGLEILNWQGAKVTAFTPAFVLKSTGGGTGGGGTITKPGGQTKDPGTGGGQTKNPGTTTRPGGQTKNPGTTIVTPGNPNPGGTTVVTPGSGGSTSVSKNPNITLTKKDDTTTKNSNAKYWLIGGAALALVALLIPKRKKK